MLSFSEALVYLKQGMALAREGWNGKGQSIEIQVPDEDSKMGLPYFYMTTVDGRLVPWVASHTDLLSSDWFVIPGHD